MSTSLVVDTAVSTYRDEEIRPAKRKTKLTTNVAIRRRVLGGESQSSVAAAFGITQHYVSELMTGRRRPKASGTTTPSDEEDT